MAQPLLPPLLRVAYTSISSSSSALKLAPPRALQTSKAALQSEEPAQWVAFSEANAWVEEKVLDSTLAFPAREQRGFYSDEVPGSQQPLTVPALNPVFSNSHLEVATVRPPARIKMAAGGDMERGFCGSSSWREGMTQIEQQEFLWQNFFLDSTEWWDNRQAKRTSRHPDFRHKRLREPLWLDNRFKPAWVDSKLAAWDAAQAARVSWPSDSTSPGIPDASKEITQKWRDFFRHFEDGQLSEAVEILDSLQKQGSYADTTLFYHVMKKCITLKDLAVGRRVHTIIHGSGYESNSFLANHIICMYASHGKLEEASEVFAKVAAPNTFMWASIIKAHSELQQSPQALKLYKQMRESAVEPDNHVFVAVLNACATTVDLEFGKEVHADILRSAIEPDIFVGNGLIDMYAKCGSLVDAREVFDGLSNKDVVTWTAMIGGYSQHELGQEALALYAVMQKEGITLPNEVTYLCLLQACANVGAVHRGEEIHAQIQQRGLEADVGLVVGLVDMYSKCGSLEEARGVLDKMCSRNVVTWTALLNGYAEHGYGQMAIQCFEDMVQQGVKPDSATFSCLLVACSHEGLVTEGRQFFHRMVDDYGIVPNVRHYTCMVDLFGRSGHLDEAENMLLTMPFENDAVGWTSLLSACKTHGDVDRGKRCFDQLVKLEPQCSTAYVLLASIYANAGRWSDAASTETMRKSVGAWKKPARSCIEVKDKVHEFIVGEEGGDVSSKVKTMNLKLKEEGGHVPHTELVLKAVPDIAKEDALCGHAEKLALAYGLLNTPDGATLLVTKNLRMCNDCHSGTTIMSRLEKREIIVRDSHRVHHFVKGSCSCGNRH